ncbi:MAG: CorA family divalent cation transporter, partial [Candidatus Dadabacteria bacterium]
LAELVEQNYALYMALREDITDLSNKVIAEKLTIDIDAILHIKKNVDRVNIVVEDQLYCINILNVYDGTAFDIGKLGKSFKNLEEEIRNGFRFLSRYERRLEDLHQHYDLMLQDKTNNRLKILTIVAAIFLPLNLVAGIYGMNFDNMPILHWEFAYHTILLFMAAVVIVMVYFFYRSGWFK